MTAFDDLRKKKLAEAEAAKTNGGIPTPTAASVTVAPKPEVKDVPPTTTQASTTPSTPSTPTPAPAPVQTTSTTAPPSPQPQPTQQVAPSPTAANKKAEPKEGWDDTPITEADNLSIVICADKNGSKTTTAFSATLLPTKLHPNPTIDQPNEYRMAVLSFDYKATRVWKELYKGNPNIVIYDPLKYRTKETDDDNLQSAERTYQYIRHLLTEGAIAKGNFDFILVDALEVLKETFEMTMKKQMNMRPYEQADWTNWRKRTDLMDDIDLLVKRVAKKAVIYTAYPKLREVKEKGSQVYTMVEPAWAGNTKIKADIVIRIESKETNGVKEYLATVTGSKTLTMPTTSKPAVVGTVDANNVPHIIGLSALGNI